MIDVHSHILYGIDDGAKTIEESLEIIKKMYKLGFRKMIATSHYIPDTEYRADNKRKKAILKELKLNLENLNIPMELYLGNEIYIHEDIVEHIKEQKIYAMNQTNYLLIELSLEEEEDSFEIINGLVHMGVKVLLAHPERYLYFQENPRLLKKYLELGVLLQGNIDSLIGKYGVQARKLFLFLLRHHYYFTLGSDIHHNNSHFFEHFLKVKRELIKLTDDVYVSQLLEENPLKIINGVYMETVAN